MEYKIIRSDRKTLALEVTANAEVLVRAPRRIGEKRIKKFVEENSEWVEKHLERAKHRAELHPEPTEEEKEYYIAEAKRYIPERAAYYSELMGVTPVGITITGARKRFGSCSGKNRICFSWRVMEYPPELVDYVIVHELAHIKHHNHSRDFYGFVASVMPDHKERSKKLKYE